MDSTGKRKKPGTKKSSRRTPLIRHEFSPEELARLAARAALAKNAEDPVILRVSELVNYTDYLVIVSGRSSRQTQTIAENVLRALAGAGHKPLGIEGEREGLWILVDAGSVVIHVFHHPVREFYELEKIWGDAPRLPAPEE